MQEYFVNTIQSKLIKNILSNTPLPICDTIRPGDYILKSFIYIHKCDVIECIKSGIFGEDAEVKVRNHFELGTYYPKFTEKFVSSELFYDRLTHRELGHLLRVYRDCWDLDLLPFYNCWCNEYLTNFYIADDGIYIGDSSHYKTAIVPIKFNKTYTIALDSSSAVRMAPIFIENNVLVPGWEGSAIFDVTSSVCSRNDYSNIITKLSTSFKQPFTVCISNKEEDKHSEAVQRTERYMYLMIQCQATTNSTLVVLEGDYTNIGTLNIINLEYAKKISPITVNRNFLSKLDLLQMSTKEQRPFSNRLIEFLTENVITQRDPLKNNILRAQHDKTREDGIWSLELRQKIYNTYMQNNNVRKVDITGYVDKDIEYAMLKGYV